MSTGPIDFQEASEKALRQLKSSSRCVLATADGNHVTAREMMLLADENKIYMVTGDMTRKYRQIQANPNVALAVGNLQAEGTAALKGHPSQPQNKAFMEAMEREMKNAPPEISDVILGICKNPDSPYRVIEFTPVRLQLYFPPPDFHIDIIDMKNRWVRHLDNSSADWHYD
jgi:uncharacterized pyridoxamine 5'-phosphate oxidase family protein